MEHIYRLPNGNLAKDLAVGRGSLFLLGLNTKGELYFPGAMERETLNKLESLSNSKIIHLQDIPKIKFLQQFPSIRETKKFKMSSKFLIPNPKGDFTSSSEGCDWEACLRLENFKGDYFHLLAIDLEPDSGIERFKLPWGEYIGFLEDEILLYAV